MELNPPSRHDIAYYLCVSHISGALIPATRISKILEAIFHKQPLTELSLQYLQKLNLNELHQFAVGQLTYDAYIAALDPALVASEQAAKEKHRALELERLTQQTQRQLEFKRQQDAAKAAHKAREAERKKAAEAYEVKRIAEIEARRKTTAINRIAQKKQLQAEEIQRAAQFKADEVIRIAQYEYNLKTAAALYELSLSAPGYVAKTPNELIQYYRLSDQQDAASAQLNNILSMLYQGLSLPAADIRYLKSNGNPRLYKLAIGLLSYESYIAEIKAEKLALKQAEALRLEREAAIEAERIASIKRAEEQRLQREKDAEVARLAHVRRVEELRIQREAEEAARIALESDPAYILRKKYAITDNIAPALLSELMPILQSFDAGERLNDESFVWLNTKAKSCFSKSLRDAHHQREAKFYASEYRRTHDTWSAVNASGHYRKCDQSQHAVNLLKDVPSKSLKKPKVHSAWCTTHGGALRDLGQRSEAFQLGLKAHELQPKNFQPCTLLGALSMELGNLTDGHEWYRKAEDRGASQRSIDTELKSILLRADKAQRKKMKEFLLADDPVRYSWVNDKKYQSK